MSHNHSHFFNAMKNVNITFMKTTIKSYDQKIANALVDLLILKMMSHHERCIGGIIHYGITGKEMLLRLRAAGSSVGNTTVYATLARLRRNGLITKGRQEADFIATEVAYYSTEAGLKYYSQMRAILRSLVN